MCVCECVCGPPLIEGIPCQLPARRGNKNTSRNQHLASHRTNHRRPVPSTAALHEHGPGCCVTCPRSGRCHYCIDRRLEVRLHLRTVVWLPTVPLHLRQSVSRTAVWLPTIPLHLRQSVSRTAVWCWEDRQSAPYSQGGAEKLSSHSLSLCFRLVLCHVLLCHEKV